MFRFADRRALNPTSAAARIRATAAVALAASTLASAGAAYAATSSATPPGWTTPDTVSTVSGFPGQRLVAAGSGLVTGYEDVSARSWVYRRHTAAGWSAPRVLMTGATSSHVDDLALSATGTTVRAVVPTGFNNETLTFVIDEGTHLHKLVLGRDVFQPAMTTDSAGLSTVVAESYAGSTAKLRTWQVSPSGTLVSSRGITLPNPSWTSGVPQITVDSAGVPLVVFSQSPAGQNDPPTTVYGTRLVGGRWTMPAAVATAVADPQYLNLAGSPQRALLVYTAQATNSVYVNTFRADTGWSAPATASATGGGLNEAAVANLDTAGNAAIVTGGGGPLLLQNAGSSLWTSTAGWPTPPGNAYCYNTSAVSSYEANLLVVGFTVSNAAGNCVLRESQFGTSRPDAPTGTTATFAGSRVKVTWHAPARTGGDPIISSTVTSSPGGATVTVGGDLTAASVKALLPGTYTFTVVTTTASGTSVASPPSNPVGYPVCGTNTTTQPISATMVDAHGDVTGDTSDIQLNVYPGNSTAPFPQGGVVIGRPLGSTVVLTGLTAQVDDGSGHVTTKNGTVSTQGWYEYDAPAGSSFVSGATVTGISCVAN